MGRPTDIETRGYEALPSSPSLHSTHSSEGDAAPISRGRKEYSRHWYLAPYGVLLLFFFLAASFHYDLHSKILRPNSSTVPEASPYLSSLSPSSGLRVPSPADFAAQCEERASSSTPCRFLLPTTITEQETSAQRHLHQLGLLAHSLDRILVLPNVGASRIALCSPHPFHFYYDVDALAKAGIATITQSDFEAYAKRRESEGRDLQAQILSLREMRDKATVGGIKDAEPNEDAYAIPGAPQSHCLRIKHVSVTDWKTTIMTVPGEYADYPERRAPFNRQMIDFLRSGGGRRDGVDAATPDVLAFAWFPRRLLLDDAFPPEGESWADQAPTDPESAETTLQPLPSGIIPFRHFDYSSAWISLASLIADQLSPFIAIHWRTETLAGETMIPCEEELVSQIRTLTSEQPEIKNVYLATDYPIEQLAEGFDGKAVMHSATFNRSMTAQHHEAMRALLADMGTDKAPNGVQMTTLDQQQRSVILPPELENVFADATARLSNGRLRRRSRVQARALPTRLEELDAALLGIVSNQVLTRAEIFMAGWPGHSQKFRGSLGPEEEAEATRMTGRVKCGRLSSYTWQVTAERRENLARLKEGSPVRGADRLQNLIQYWGP